MPPGGALVYAMMQSTSTWHLGESEPSDEMSSGPILNGTETWLGLMDLEKNKD